MIERMIISMGLIASAIFGFYFMKRRHLSQANLVSRDHRLKSSIPAILYFWSPACHVCITIQKPLIDLILNENGNEKIQFVPINVDADQNYADKWGVMTVPSTFILDNQGACKYINSGLVREDALRTQLENVVKS